MGYVMIKFNVVELIKDANFIVQYNAHAHRHTDIRKQHNTTQYGMAWHSAADAVQHRVSMYVGNKVWYFDFNMRTSGE